MQSFKIAQITEVSAGKVESLTYENSVWLFVFENGLMVESYAGWNLNEHNYGTKLILGSRDVAQSENPFKAVTGVLGNATCEMISFNAISNVTQLQFLKGEDRLSIELLNNSVSAANWKIVIGDHEESDIE